MVFITAFTHWAWLRVWYWYWYWYPIAWMIISLLTVSSSSKLRSYARLIDSHMKLALHIRCICASSHVDLVFLVWFDEFHCYFVLILLCIMKLFIASVQFDNLLDCYLVGIWPAINWRKTEALHIIEESEFQWGIGICILVRALCSNRTELWWWGFCRWILFTWT